MIHYEKTIIANCSIIGIIIVAFAAYLVLRPRTGIAVDAAPNNMKISSPVFDNNGDIPPIYTCDGESINPPLNVENIPENAKSLALIIKDPDAPSGTFVHWVVWNIAPDTTIIKENSLPQGATEGITSANKNGYVGPCPPSGTHHYFFKLYALDTMLSLDSNINASALMSAMQNHILSQAELVGTYNRN